MNARQSPSAAAKRATKQRLLRADGPFTLGSSMARTHSPDRSHGSHTQTRLHVHRLPITRREEAPAVWPHSARPKQRNNRPIAASIGLVAAVLAVLAFGVLAPGEPSLAAGSGTWTTYHHDARRSGVDPDQTPFSSVSFDWSVPVDGDVYAQPLVWNGHVYVATEENTVFAFDATTGQSVWTQKLGAAVPSTVVPNGCANANPHLGVTSTPVIDPATARMYLVAQEDLPLRYELWTLDLNNGGAPISRQTIDPWPGTPQQQATQNALEVQRGALLLANGYVYVNFGGRAECGQAANTLPDYHGWV